MLSELSIENFAIIDRLLVRFEPGFTVLTGETGAGKSIIIDALQAALGAKVGSEVVRGEARAAAVEALFALTTLDKDDPLDVLLTELGVDTEDCLVLRREILASGRTSARVNGRTVPSSTLSAIGRLLVDIHGQSDHLSILRSERQLDVLDRFGDLQRQRKQVSTAIKDVVAARASLHDLVANQREAEQRLDLLRFQVQEIESAQLQPDEDRDLEIERHLLGNAERLTQLSARAYDVLHGDAGAASDAVSDAVTAVNELAAVDPGLVNLSERLRATQIELDDIAQEVRQYRDAVEYDPKRLEAVEERLDLLIRLKRKYGATIEQILQFGLRARAEMEEVENFDARLQDLRSRVEEAEAIAARRAGILSDARQAVATALTDSMRDALEGLELKGTYFAVEITQTPDPHGLFLPERQEHFAYSPSGLDRVRFLVSFNPGELPRPLEKVASGGETSRFLLALKSVLAGADETPTLIFDEVEAGVGGRRGLAVGQRMRDLSHDHQVICISHLPQVAALADHHVTVSKSLAKERTTVVVRSLEVTERVSEIADMMSGTATEAARRSAEELLEAVRRTD